MMVALNEPHSGNIPYEKAKDMCHSQAVDANMVGTFWPFISWRRRMDTMVHPDNQMYPIVNLKVGI